MYFTQDFIASMPAIVWFQTVIRQTAVGRIAADVWRGQLYLFSFLKQNETPVENDRVRSFLNQDLFVIDLYQFFECVRISVRILALESYIINSYVPPSLIRKGKWDSKNWVLHSNESRDSGHSWHSYYFNLLSALQWHYDYIYHYE